MEINNLFGGIFRNRRVLVTGHTGFKGSWLCLVLNKLGADIYGYALDPPTNPSLYKIAKVSDIVTSYIGDIRDFTALHKWIQNFKPEIIIHMAAQPLVRESYKNPVETYSVNVMGTVHLLEAVRLSKGVKAVVNVTTDKCYENREWLWGYRENEAMGGYDPYSNSKGCSELVSSSFRSSFFNSRDYDKHGTAIATARAGNVIGGGDWAADRLIPDFIRAINAGDKIRIRSPYAIRPWQHVMEPLNGYLTLAAKLFSDGAAYAQAYNFGPDDVDTKNVEWITRKICSLWGEGVTYEIDSNYQMHEANYLKLDCSKAKHDLNWHPIMSVESALQSIVEWTKAWKSGKDMRVETELQIENYFSLLIEKLK